MYREQALENFYMVKEASKTKLVNTVSKRLRGSSKMGGVVGIRPHLEYLSKANKDLIRRVGPVRPLGR